MAYAETDVASQLILGTERREHGKSTESRSSTNRAAGQDTQRLTGHAEDLGPEKSRVSAG